jgi:hypothetical protein
VSAVTGAGASVLFAVEVVFLLRRLRVFFLGAGSVEGALLSCCWGVGVGVGVEDEFVRPRFLRFFRLTGASSVGVAGAAAFADSVDRSTSIFCTRSFSSAFFSAAWVVCVLRDRFLEVRFWVVFFIILGSPDMHIVRRCGQRWVISRALYHH